MSSKSIRPPSRFWYSSKDRREHFKKRPVEDPVQSRGFLLENREIEAEPCFLDLFRELPGSRVARPLHRDIVISPRTDSQRSPKHSLWRAGGLANDCNDMDATWLRRVIRI